MAWGYHLISFPHSRHKFETTMTTSPAPHPGTLKTPTPKSKLKAKAYQSVNPSDGKTLKTFEKLTDAQLEMAIATAATCFETWRHKTFAERAIVAVKAAAIMRERVEEFARPVTLEMGKLIEQARGEVMLSADIIEYYAWNAEGFLAPQAPQAQFG